MKWRVSSGLVLVLYVLVAGFFGVIHDHQCGEDHCAACAWVANAVTDAPAPAVQVTATFASQTPVAPEVVVLVAPVLCNTGSRAPPLASA
jgi:hypothetical protein